MHIDPADIPPVPTGPDYMSKLQTLLVQYLRWDPAAATEEKEKWTVEAAKDLREYHEAIEAYIDSRVKTILRERDEKV